MICCPKVEKLIEVIKLIKGVLSSEFQVSGFRFLYPELAINGYRFWVPVSGFGYFYSGLAGNCYGFTGSRFALLPFLSSALYSHYVLAWFVCFLLSRGSRSFYLLFACYLAVSLFLYLSLVSLTPCSLNSTSIFDCFTG